MNTVTKNRTFGPKQMGIIFFTAALMLMSASFCGGQNNTVFPALAEMRSWNLNVLNIWSGIAALMDGICIILFSRLSRKNSKGLAGVALLIMALCLALYGIVTNQTLFIVLMLIAGTCSGIFSSTCAMTITANWWPTKKGIVLGFSTIGVVLMQIVYVPVMPRLFAAMGVRNTQFLLAIITVGVALISFFLIKDTPEEAGTTPDGLEGKELEDTQAVVKALREYKSPYTLKVLVKDPSNWTLGFGMMLPMIAALSYIASTIPALLSMGYSMEVATLVFAVCGIFCIIGSALFGVIDQKIGTKKATTVYLVCMIISIIIAMFMEHSLVLVWIASGLLMGANGSVRNLMPSFVGTRYGRWDYPAAYGMIGTIGMLGGGLGLMITGIFTNFKTLYIFDLILLIVAFILIRVTKDSFIGKRDE